MTDSNRIIIFDTTLRDGEQSPGASMNLEEKVLIAEALDKMGVDVIEAGFGRASRGDFEAIQAVARTVKHAAVCSLARALKEDIDAAAESIKPAERRRIHTFISTSPLHMEYKLKMRPEQVLEAITESVSYARRFTDDVEWSCEDGSRSELEFLCRAVETAIKAGATTINVPDTVGYALPDEYGALIDALIKRVPNSDKAIFSVHCHNDLGLAVANSLAAVKAGARQVECTINGLGERAGNAALEEIVMTLKVRHNSLPYTTGVDATHITRLSRLVSTVTGITVQNNKAIVGANAFAHESGIHQHGMLSHRGTYEIMTPESVGLTRSNLVLGKHSGRHAFKAKLQDLGFDLEDAALDDAFTRFKELADRKKEVYDQDVVALVDPLVFRKNQRIEFIDLRVESHSGEETRAHLELEIEGKRETTDAIGVGPVDAIFKAIRNLAPHTAQLQLYQVHAVTKGTDSQAEVTVRLEDNGSVYNGHGADLDTLCASAIAYVNALNSMKWMEGRVVAEKQQRIVAQEKI